MSKKRLESRIFNSGHRDEDFENYTKELLETESLTGEAVVGIAKKIVTEGVPSLTERQLQTFIDFGLWGNNYQEECNRCSQEIPWSEMRFALTEYGNCAYCQHKIDKDE